MAEAALAMPPSTLPLALIVEDDRKLADIFNRALRTSGFATEVLRDGLTAQARLAEVQPALLLLDLHLPGLSGIMLVDQVRADVRLAGAVIVVASADPQLARTLQGRVDFVMAKPVSFRALRRLASELRPI